MQEPPQPDTADPRLRRRAVASLSGRWSALPATLRRTIVSVVGATLVLLGLALVVLPGPFTVPLLIAGFAVLGTEFAWAAAALARTRRELDRAGRVGRKAVRTVMSKAPRRRTGTGR